MTPIHQYLILGAILLHGTSDLHGDTRLAWQDLRAHTQLDDDAIWQAICQLNDANGLAYGKYGDWAGYLTSDPMDEAWRKAYPPSTTPVPPRLPTKPATKPVAANKRIRLIERDKHTCRYCGNEGTISRGPDGHPWTADHIEPQSKGGSNDIDNLALACRSCNSRKGNRPKTPMVTT